MLTKVEVQTRSNQFLTFDLEDEDNEYYIKDITNLDPVKAEMVSSGLASVDGDQYQSSRLGPRNPVITLGLQDIADNSIRALRQQLYGYFMPKSSVTLVFHDDEYKPVKLSGRVEDFSSPPFQKDPEATISVICFDPAFYELDTQVVDASIPVSGSADVSIPYSGTLDTGLVLKVTINNDAGAPNGIQLTMQKSAGQTELMEIRYPLVKNDVLTVSTLPGEKTVTLNRNNQVDSILYALTYQSGWISLSPGTNKLRINGPIAASRASSASISWVNKHGGL